MSTRAALRKDLKAYLKDAAGKFEPSDLDLHLDAAAADLARVRPLVVSASLTMAVGVSLYAAPADMIRPLCLDWGADVLPAIKPWDDNWPGALPTVSLSLASGVRQIQLSTPATAKQISVLGATAQYRYAARYVLADDANDTTVPEASSHLLLIRAAAAALQSLALNGAAKPVTLGGKAGMSLPKNGTPQALADQLMELFERMAQ